MLFDRFVDYIFLYTVLDKFELYVWRMVQCCFVNSSKAIACCPKHSTEPGLKVTLWVTLSFA